MTRIAAALVLPALVMLAGCAHRETLTLLHHEGGTPGDAGAVAVLDPDTGREIGLVDRADSRAKLRPGSADVRTSGKSLEPRHAALFSAMPRAPEPFVLTFDTNDVALDAASQALVPKLVQTVLDWPGADLAIVGHTDSAGEDDYNDTLSEDRAQAVARIIEAAGVDVMIVEVVGRGERQPLVPNPPDGHERRNRRVEVIVR
ncbi:outer membrane protein OmpA-like peptidoglycan-associated protein [Sphingomonas zeicaulis]|uniref:OmpA family protein n=1 Tax=Sphingomonas zeicaulis TaxID=1632740 RepID=UPI003D250E08